MLGPLKLLRGGVPVELPASRKVRGLLAYLAMAPRPVTRSRLCDLLWDGPNDPRGELRWCLSRLRSVLDDPDVARVEAQHDVVSVRLDNCFVDIVEVATATAHGIDALSVEELRRLADLFAGDFMEGLDIDRSPEFDTWLVTQRRRFRAAHAVVLEHLVRSLSADADDLVMQLEKWIELTPFDERAHSGLLAALAAGGRFDEGEEHLATACRLFEAEGLDPHRLRVDWRAARTPRPPEPTRAAVEVLAPQPSIAVTAEGARRASIAIMPFVDEGGRGAIGAGLTGDIITRLAKLRSLFVIARGSVFSLAERNIGPEDAGRRLNVDYVSTGSVRLDEARVEARVELIETRTARIVFSDSFESRHDDAFAMLDTIGNMIVSAIASEVEVAERNRAMLKPPNSLDAWEAHHRGLWHMYRFTRVDNDQARHFFRMATQLDPTFARAHAGMSFTHWQSAFQSWSSREEESRLALESAARALLADDHDPAAHWAMGRALWLNGSSQDESLAELGRAVELSPNFALGHYALSFVHSQAGDPQIAIDAADHSRQLSPFDPLMFGMLGARAMAHVRLSQFDEAAEWALKAAAKPNAHAIILAITAHCLALAGRIDEGRAFSAKLCKINPGYRVDDFLATFRFDPEAVDLFRRGARRIGLG
jgi:DNA-binding SARP family transcriptional activator/TolB-like protein